MLGSQQNRVAPEFLGCYRNVMNRRQFLEQTGIAGASLAAAAPFSLLLGCAPRRNAASAANRAYAAPDISFIGGACGLPPVHVSADREIRTVVGLRPYRPSGFVVRAEKLDDTLVIHNYGHGGGGITLAWGTAKLALDLGLPGHTGPVAVLGCGAVGLATARLLQEGGAEVTIYAKDLPPNTTSNIAGGQWFPAFVSQPEKRTALFNQQFQAAMEFAYQRYQIMVGPQYGVRWMRNYFLDNQPWNEQTYFGKESVVRSMLPEFRDLSPHEHPFPGYQFVRQFDTMIIEPPIYVAALMDEIRLAGASFKVMELRNRGEIQKLPEKLVFNCTGLGAKALFADDELTPLKGQLTILLPQPEVQYATLALPPEVYMFPRTDGILLGGTHEVGVWSLDPNLEKKQEILAQHKAFFDSFKKC
jgi:glycine/D-amino acid oxidase-like deaminating enzyme